MTDRPPTPPTPTANCQLPTANPTLPAPTANCQLSTVNLILFRYRPPRPVRWVDLRGDFTHWMEPVELKPSPADACPEAELRVPTGVYGYKFRLADGGWELDPANPRTRSRDGLRNSVLSVGGASEPILHAPVRPWVRLEDDGRLAILAGVRRGHGSDWAVRWDEGHGPRLATMHEVAAEDEHVLLRAWLPASAREVAYRFQRADGAVVGAEGGAGQAFVLHPGALGARTPAWWRDAVLYTVFVDRFRRGRAGGAWAPLTREDARAGGDLDGVTEALPALADLGVTVLHLTPVCPAPSAHRYDATDPRAVDPALGGEAALARLLDAAHARGIRVLLDLVMTHVHRDAAPFVDVRAHGPASPFWDWFRPRRFPFLEGPDPGYDHYKDRWDEPLLRGDHPEVQEWVAGTASRLVGLGADGLRLDAVAEVPLAMAERVRDAVRAANPDVVLAGEVTVDNPWRWAPGTLDAATDFGFREGLLDWLVRGHGAARAAATWARGEALRGGPGWASLALAGTHDHPRIRTLAGAPGPARLALLRTLTAPGIPALLYGDEVGMGGGDPARVFEDAWPDRGPYPWDPSGQDGTTRDLVRRALAARKASAALSRGDEELLPPEVLEGDRDAVVQARRTAGDEVVDVVLNGSPAAVTLRLAGGAPSGARVLVEVGADGNPPAGSPDGTLVLGPWSGVVLRREPPAAVARAWAEARSRNRDRCTAAFRAGRLVTLALPALLDIVVTEACNLRCRHCINDSPGRTARGTARTIRPWVLDRLREAFSACDRVSFSHGGESTASPALWDVLAALREAREGRPLPDVHLVTNGMRMDGPAVRRLAEAGVNSLAVSLDGADAAACDAIRGEGVFDRVVANVRQAVRLRTEGRLDLRIGISSVVGRDSVPGLRALVRLAEDLGVDWLKLEEMHPATPFARRQVTPLPPEGLLAALDLGTGILPDGREVPVTPRGVVVVDHAGPAPEGTSPAGARFRAADDFANRASFRPEQAAWDQACIGPDGTVHPVDWDHGPVGNLLDASLLDLWDAPALQALRAQVLAARR